MTALDMSHFARRQRAWFDTPFGLALSGVAAFMVIFNITFAALPSPSTLGAVVRVGTVFLLWIGIDAYRRFVNDDAGALLLLLALTGYAFVQWALTGFSDSGQAVRAFAFVLYGIYGALLMASLFRGDDMAFVRACTIAGALQAVLIVYSFMSPDYRVWLSGVVQQSGNIDLVTGFSAPGFSNSAGALLSVSQAACVFAAVYGSRQAQRLWVQIAFVVSALLITASTVLAGRTGLILSCAFLGVFGVDAAVRNRWRVISAALICILVLAIVGNAAIQAVATRAGADPAFLKSWAFELFQKGTGAASYSDLASQPVPGLSLSTIVGTGRVTAAAPWAGTASGNDSGYVQTYFALGLIASVLFYSTVAWLSLRATMRANAPLLLGAFAVSMFVIEAKEPFMFKSPMPLMLFALAFMRYARPENRT
ncbi:MAG: hypothetical protein ABI026_02610 [Gemmatimonadaceae bacterium]